MIGPLVSDRQLAELLALAAPDSRDASQTPGPAALASPSYLGLESRSVRIAANGGLFFKVIHPEMREGFSLQTAMALASAAGRAGIGPEVLWSDPEAGAILMRDPGPDWISCRQWQLQDVDVVTAALFQIQRLHNLPALRHRFDPFAEIDRMLHQARIQNIGLPQDIAWVLALMEPMRQPLAAAPLVASRNDGSASNLLVGPEPRDVMLVDYDRAGMNDPMYDLGVLLAETTDFETDMIPLATVYMGRFDDGAFARARLWSLVDDVMHCLWARVTGGRSVRGTIEWLKYSEWRIMRARLALRHPGFEEKLRRIGVAA
jgi:thiamine kinase-like enzyme